MKPVPVEKPPRTAVQVRAALEDLGYRCGRQSSYLVCRLDGVGVRLLTGRHNRPPVISFHATGTPRKAHTEIAKHLSRVLERAHVNEELRIAAWYAGAASTSTASTTIGGWRIEHAERRLTLTDRFCTQNCRAR